MADIQIVAIGNELLLGDVLDTNTNWLCRQITGLGGEVARASMIHDDLDQIVGELRTACAAESSIAVLTTGGLGPTHDDMTLQAVARATGRRLATNRAALEMVQATYSRLADASQVASAELTESRIKMARLPQGAIPLENPVGAAPGALLRLERCSIICLPGVPEELRGIFTTSMQPFLKEIFGAGAYLQRRLVIDSGDESSLAPILAAVAARHSEVYTKSRPKRFGPDVRILATLSASGDDTKRIAALLEASVTDLASALAAQDITAAVER